MNASEIIQTSMRQLFETLDAPAVWHRANGESIEVYGDIADNEEDSTVGSMHTAISDAVFHCMAADIEGIEEGDTLIKDAQRWTVVGCPKVDHSTGLAEVHLRWEEEVP